ncbi:hypothetical protein FKR81_16680 [Lentzea tibetensis]|uniref:Uncharacterized protein n=1 Tax=Lentzea tibetensis TaxID=2591470 RepID=A0A563EUN4_9PSEU|nr:hypothetical protein [Lentzea tibetensis]TWP51248.1 hypothetical protein FKR81_16680 [Lentzea tibetensis]
MSTTPASPDGHTPAPQDLAELLARWAGQAPRWDAEISELADWFELKVLLLIPITADPWHDDYEQAWHMSRLAARTATSLRDKEAGR